MKDIPWKKISHFEGPEHSPGFLLWQVSTKWRREIETALATVTLTHPQFVLLASLGWLTRHQNDITQIELARHCGTDVNMTSQVLRSLEQKGYIERHRRKGDERSKFPKLTEQGAKLVEQAIPLVEKVDDEFFSTLGSRKTKECINILQKLAEPK
ncbi:MAG: MarR family transcriptional regulator [Parachlamydiaceae bacterium]|nr:MarR family transcriptional regulator [Parachlamydiaceae bacterium]